MSYSEDYLQDINKICSKVDCSSCPLIMLPFNPMNYERPVCKLKDANPKDWNIEDLKKRITAWKTAHPSKTRQSEFIKLVPNARIEDGVLDVSPCILDMEYSRNNCKGISCTECKAKYWGEEIE